MSATSSCHLSLSAAMLAASVKDSPMVATSLLTMSIYCKGGHLLCLFTSDTLRVSIKTCAAGEFEVARMQWTNHFRLLLCTILLIGSWPSCSSIQDFIRNDVGIVDGK